MANSFVTRMIMDRRRRERERDGNRDYEHEDMRSRDNYDRGYRDGYDRARGEYEGNFRGNYQNDHNMDGRMYDSRYNETDGRQGVKGTGMYGIGGSKYYPSRDRDNMDRGDYGDDIRLTPKEIEEWKRMLRNTDGTSGAHFTMSQVQQAAQSIGSKMKDFSEEELCMAMNYLYSDMGDAFKPFVPKEKEPIVYARAAMGKYFDDPDGKMSGSGKLTIDYMVATDME